MDLMQSAIYWVQIRMAQLQELHVEQTLARIISRSIYFGKELAVVQMDLRSLPCETAPTASKGVEVTRVTTSSDISGILVQPKSRRIKASMYTKRGCEGFVFSRNGVSIGDIWYVPCGCQSRSVRDLKWLHVCPNDRDVYLFDMYLQPEARGLGCAAPLLKASLGRLRDAGFQNAYGFYWFDNLSALWMHRMLKYKEIDKRKAYAFFSLRYSVTIKDQCRGNGAWFLRLPKAGVPKWK